MKTMGGKCKDIWRSVQSRIWLHKELSNASFYSCKKYIIYGPSIVLQRGLSGWKRLFGSCKDPPRVFSGPVTSSTVHKMLIFFSIFSNAICYYQNIFMQLISTFAQRSGLFGNLKCLWSRWSFPLSLAIFWLTELNKTHNYWYAKCAWAWATTLQHAKISRAGIL